MSKLASALAVSAIWTIWKTFGVLTWPESSSWRYLLVHMTAAPIIFILLYYMWVFWALRVLKGKYGKEVTLRTLSLGLLAASPLTAALYFFAGRPSIEVILLTSVTFSVFGGVVEEAIYRGILQDALSERMDMKYAILAQSSLFGLSHPWNPAVILGAFIFGIVLGLMRNKVGMGSNIAFHWLINTVTSA